MEMVLSDLKLNQKAKLRKITSTDSVLMKKLLSVGLLKGIDVEVLNKSFLGDPIEITVKGYNLSLRKYEAEQIIVEA